MATIGFQYSMSIIGSTIIPTDTKNIAPNKSFTGDTRLSMRSASSVSARILPMMNAPKAAEKPHKSATTTIAKHNPRATISIVSLLSIDLNFLKNSGSRKIPVMNHKMSSPPSFSSEKIIFSPSKLRLTAIVLNITISTMARISSMMRTERTSPANFCCRSPRSSKAL